MRKIVFGIAILAMIGIFLSKKSENKVLNGVESIKVSVQEALMPSTHRGGSETSKEVPATAELRTESGKTSWKSTLSVANDLSYKVIRSKKDIQLLKETLGSVNNISKAAGILKTWDKHDLKNNETARMDSIMFLQRAIDFKENPEKSFVEKTIYDLIADTQMNEIADRDLKKSVIADRIELYALLRQSNPAMAVQLEESVSSDLHRKIIRYSTQLYKFK